MTRVTLELTDEQAETLLGAIDAGCRFVGQQLAQSGSSGVAEVIVLSARLTELLTITKAAIDKKRETSTAVLDNTKEA